MVNKCKMKKTTSRAILPILASSLSIVIIVFTVFLPWDYNTPSNWGPLVKIGGILMEPAGAGEYPSQSHSHCPFAGSFWLLSSNRLSREASDAQKSSPRASLLDSRRA